MNHNKLAFIAELAKLRPASTFLTLKGYCNDYGEVADYNIIFHFSYENALKKSILTLEKIIPDNDLKARAKNELITSFSNSLTKLQTTPMEELEDHYQWFLDENGKHIKGIKYHTKSDTLHLYGLLVHKRVLVPGIYPKKNKQELTIAKDKLRKLCVASKFRQFKITPYDVNSIQVQKLSLMPPE